MCTSEATAGEKRSARGPTNGFRAAAAGWRLCGTLMNNKNRRRSFCSESRVSSAMRSLDWEIRAADTDPERINIASSHWPVARITHQVSLAAPRGLTGSPQRWVYKCGGPVRCKCKAKVLAVTYLCFTFHSLAIQWVCPEEPEKMPVRMWGPQIYGTCSAEQSERS